MLLCDRMGLEIMQHVICYIYLLFIKILWYYSVCSRNGLEIKIFTISLSHPSLLKKLWHKVKLIPYPSLPAQPTKTTNDGFPVCIIFLSGAIPQIQREMTSPQLFWHSRYGLCGVHFFFRCDSFKSKRKDHIPSWRLFRQFLFSWKYL